MSGRLPRPFAFGFASSGVLEGSEPRWAAVRAVPGCPSPGSRLLLSPCSPVPAGKPLSAGEEYKQERPRPGSRAGVSSRRARRFRDFQHLARGPRERRQHSKTTPSSRTQSRSHRETLPSPWADKARSFPRGRGWPCGPGDPRSGCEYGTRPAPSPLCPRPQGGPPRTAPWVRCPRPGRLCGAHGSLRRPTGSVPARPWHPAVPRRP